MNPTERCESFKLALADFLNSSMVLYDINSGTVVFGNDFSVRITLPKIYRIPPACVEFMNIASPAIIKAYASPLYIRTDDSKGFNPLIPVSWWRLPDLNFPDWILFMDEGELSMSDFYVNCNPDSKRYGQILFTNDVGEWSAHLQTQPTIFSDIYHLVKKIELWIRHVKISDTFAIRDICVQHFLDSKYDGDDVERMPQGITRRQILEDPEITAWDTDRDIIEELQDDVIDILIYPETVNMYSESAIYLYDDISGTYGTFSSWIWDGLHLH
jgi:hypothetical protein